MKRPYVIATVLAALGGAAAIAVKKGWIKLPALPGHAQVQIAPETTMHVTETTEAVNPNAVAAAAAAAAVMPPRELLNLAAVAADLPTSGREKKK